MIFLSELFYHDRLFIMFVNIENGRSDIIMFAIIPGFLLLAGPVKEKKGLLKQQGIHVAKILFLKLNFMNDSIDK